MMMASILVMTHIMLLMREKEKDILKHFGISF